MDCATSPPRAFVPFTASEQQQRKYKTLLIDPPWPQGKTGRRKVRPNQGKHLTYPTLSLEQIQNLPLEPICAADCLLFLWATDKYLAAAHAIIAHWGFRKHCVFVWNKPTGVCPFSVQFRNEFLLLAYHGKFKLQTIGLPTYFFGPVRKHSQKPDESYRLIEKISFPPRLELFARRRMSGWDVWGNEVRSTFSFRVA